MFHRLIPFVGILVMVALCLAISKDRRAALKRWPLIAWGLGLQFGFALLILTNEPGRWVFQVFNDVFVAVANCTKDGAAFVFGDQLTNPMTGLGYFAFFVLPTIIFFSALTAILYQVGILQRVVKGIAWVMARTMKTSGAETLSASANIFVGQTEAPLMVRPFIGKMTDSELMTVMTGGFATVAGSVMAAYIFFLQDSVPNIAGHLLAASVMSAPAALLFGKLIVPETGTPETYGNLNVEMPKAYENTMDAAAGGAAEGVKLALNVGGMIIAFLALLALVNLILQAIVGVPSVFTEGGFELDKSVTIQGILGDILAPLAWLMGIPWDEAPTAGQYMGLKTITNEFVAFAQFADAQKVPGEAVSSRTAIILTYALAGFANIGSIGIQIGGLMIMAPERRADLARLGFLAMIAGTLACNSTGCVAAILTPMNTERPSAVVQTLAEPDAAEEIVEDLLTGEDDKTTATEPLSP
ncbi:MAG: nucleoside transporter C-terminal domain-containing protein [Sumerlaeia bacterium]